MELSAIARGYDAFLLDLDGCLWVGDEPTPRAPEALHALREAGKEVAFLTNDARHTVEDFVRKLWRLGFQASVDEVVTVGAAVQHALAGGPDRSAFVIGAQALVDHVAEAGLRIVNNTDFASRAEVVVVAAHDRFDYRELRIAAQAVLGGAELIGATRDRTFPMPDGAWPATGAVLAAVETAVGRPADRVIGKPEPPMYEAALERLGGGRVIGVGDRLDIDMAGARAAGLETALVLTGAATHADLRTADPLPHHVAGSFAELVLAG